MNSRELQESKLERAFCAAHCACDKDGEKKALEAIKAAETMPDLESSVYNLQMDILACRNCLQPIVDGEMERERSVAGQREYHAGRRGMKKVSLKDARKIAKHVVWKINRALDDFEKATN